MSRKGHLSVRKFSLRTFLAVVGFGCVCFAVYGHYCERNASTIRLLRSRGCRLTYAHEGNVPYGTRDETYKLLRPKPVWLANLLGDDAVQRVITINFTTCTQGFTDREIDAVCDHCNLKKIYIATPEKGVLSTRQVEIIQAHFPSVKVRVTLEGLEE